MHDHTIPGSDWLLLWLTNGLAGMAAGVHLEHPVAAAAATVKTQQQLLGMVVHQVPAAVKS